MNWTPEQRRRQSALAFNPHGCVVTLGDSLFSSNVSPIAGFAVVPLATDAQTVADVIAGQLPLLANLFPAPGILGALVLVGTNDVHRLLHTPGVPPESNEQFKASLAALYEGILTGLDAARVIAVTVPYWSDARVAWMIDGINEVVHLWATARGMPVVDANSLLQDAGGPGTTFPAYLVDDGIHLSNAGWAVLLPALSAACAGW